MNLIEFMALEVGGLCSLWSVKYTYIMKGLLSIVAFVIVACAIFFSNGSSANALSVSAKGAALLDVSTGKVLFSQNGDSKLYPASTTKIVTALLALENLNLDDKLTVPKDFVNDGEAGIWLESGEVHTVEDLLMAMMLRSANDAAQMLAIGVAGSTEKFADLMNGKVQELGLKNTHFVTPNGLHDENHYTTAYDLARLTIEAMKYPDFNRVIVTHRHQLPWVLGEYDRVVYNRNTLLDIYDLADGVKNGYTKQAGSCLVSSATKDTHRLVGVVLNCGDMYNQSKAMLQFGFDNYTYKELCKKGEIKGEVVVNGGKKAKVTCATATDVGSMVSNGKLEAKGKEAIRLEKSVSAPILAGDVLGKITFTDGDGFQQSANLVATENVGIHSFPLTIKQVWQSVWQVFIVPIIKY